MTTPARRSWAWGALGAFVAASIIGAATLVAFTLSQGEHARLEENRSLSVARATAYVAARRPPSEINRYLRELHAALDGGLLEAYFLGTGSVDRFGLSTGNTYQANLNSDLVGADPR